MKHPNGRDERGEDAERRQRAARLLSELAVASDDALERFLRLRLPTRRHATVERLRLARELLDELGRALAQDDGEAWEQLELAWQRLAPPVDSLSDEATHKQKRPARGVDGTQGEAPPPRPSQAPPPRPSHLPPPRPSQAPPPRPSRPSQRPPPLPSRSANKPPGHGVAAMGPRRVGGAWSADDDEETLHGGQLAPRQLLAGSGPAGAAGDTKELTVVRPMAREAEAPLPFRPAPGGAALRPPRPPLPSAPEPDRSYPPWGSEPPELPYAMAPLGGHPRGGASPSPPPSEAATGPPSQPTALLEDVFASVGGAAPDAFDETVDLARGGLGTDEPTLDDRLAVIMLEQYASLCAERHVDPSQAAVTAARLDLRGAADQQALDARWGRRLESNPAERRQFEQLYRRRREQLERGRR